MLSSKSVLMFFIVGLIVDPIKEHLARLLGRKRILAQDLRLLAARPTSHLMDHARCLDRPKEKYLTGLRTIRNLSVNNSW
jgi:hypothetical protein